MRIPLPISLAVRALLLLTALPVAHATQASTDQADGVRSQAETQVLDDPSLLWGTYRPNVYFGVRPRLPLSLLSGLMWFSVKDPQAARNIRHMCDMEDKMQGYGYKVHDGRNFGEQVIKDTSNNLRLETTFLKASSIPGGTEWSARIQGRPLDTSRPAPISLVYYVALEGEGHLEAPGDTDRLTPGLSDEIHLAGTTPDLGDFIWTLRGDSHNRPAQPLPTSDNHAEDDDPANLEQAVLYGANVDPNEVWDTSLQLRYAIGGTIRKRLRADGHIPGSPAHLFRLPPQVQEAANLYMVQYTLEAPFQLDVTFQGGAANVAAGNRETDSAAAPSDPLTDRIQAAKSEFRSRFDQTFALRAANYTPAEIRFAQAMLSDVLGGIGYFYGQQIIAKPGVGVSGSDPADEIEEEEEDWSDRGEEADSSGVPDETVFRQLGAHQVKYSEPGSLFSATPSRSFFPRGFMWDEGFLHLIVGAWDNDLALTMLDSWLARVDEDGWLAREQILGREARSRVPPEFQAQFPSHANPPTLLFAVSAFINRAQAYHRTKVLGDGNNAGDADGPIPQGQDALQDPRLNLKPGKDFDGASPYDRLVRDPALGRAFLVRIYPTLRRQFEWFQATQAGQLRQWGRHPPFPGVAYRWRGRTLNHTLASGLDDYPRADPHPGELHVDLMSWMGYMSRTLASVAQLAEADPAEIAEYRAVHQRIQANLDALHWSSKEKMYCDVTVGEDGTIADDNEGSHGDNDDADDVDNDSVLVCHRGYISLFPLLLGLVPATSPRLGHLLDLMHDPEHLWSPYGLRSLSTLDPYYGKGENYWRGPIWLNINYLALSALHTHYVKVPGPHQEQAATIYGELRRNVVKNVSRQYKKTGFLWEQYNPVAGKGQRAHPFAGWSALTLLIMAEKYDNYILE
ncbi:Processing alpha glucosidase I [Tieghemiomyces parasiticus]|uniref:Mannosyl-oligosaccharide glucosidase n=1 Tax=Tieghemiomyces parasiticus TaxID=78921 RepID=A0A9W7ZJW5_9FUNG|nr:Processing alpha glucosidase I [Tieghemiomyces parasiticus]